MCVCFVHSEDGYTLLDTPLVPGVDDSLYLAVRRGELTGGGDAAPAASTWSAKELKVGDKVESLGPVDTWCTATVTEVTKDSVRLHFAGWSDKRDRVVPLSETTLLRSPGTLDSGAAKPKTASTEVWRVEAELLDEVRAAVSQLATGKLSTSADVRLHLPACMHACSQSSRVTLPLTAIIHHPSVHPQQSVLSQTEDVVAKLLSSRLQDAKAVLPSAGALLNEVAQVRTHTAPPPPPMWCVTHPRFPTALSWLFRS